MGKENTKTIEPTAGCAESTPEFTPWINSELSAPMRANTISNTAEKRVLSPTSSLRPIRLPFTDG